MAKYSQLQERQEDDEDVEMTKLMNGTSGEDSVDVKKRKKTRKASETWRMFSLMYPERYRMLIAMLALLISSLSQVLVPHYLGSVIDGAAIAAASSSTTSSLSSFVNMTNFINDEGELQPDSLEEIQSHFAAFPQIKGNESKLNRAALIVLILATVAGLMSLMWASIFGLSGQRIVARLRMQVYRSILEKDIAWFDKSKTGELTSRLSSDCSLIQDAVTKNFAQVLNAIIKILGTIVFLFLISPVLTGLVFILVPAIGVIVSVYVIYMKKIQTKFQDELASANARAEEVISSIRTVRTFSNETREEKEYEEKIEMTLVCARKQALAEGILQGILIFLTFAIIGVVLFVGGKLTVHSSLTIGGLVSFLFYTLQLAANFVLIGSQVQEFGKALGATVRLFEIIEIKASIPIRVSKIDRDRLEIVDLPKALDGTITFKNVTFFYPSRSHICVLDGLNFEALSGQTTAVVGPSGGGKSTIINLVLRLYDPFAGYVALDGINLTTLDPSELRKNISIVSQEPTLFSCSIADNIRYGKEDSTLEEVKEVAMMANADGFITSFPDGYKTLVGERGVRLSGGQKQRIAIARALIRKPKVLLLDEATSALDSESEALVQQALDNAQKGRTVIVVAHRLSTVRSASKIVVIEKGRKTQEGTHHELMTLEDGLYHQLVSRQNLSSEESGDAVQEKINEKN